MAKAKAAKETLQLKTLSDIGEIKFVSSGVPEIDELTGGFPRARITEIFGMQGIGKTDLMLKCLSAMSTDSKVLYMDVENALNPERLLKKGATKPENIHISEESILQEVAQYVTNHVNDYDVIVVDSVAALVPREEANGESGDQFVGLKARLMGQWIRQLTAKLGKSNCALVFINQLRDSMILYGDPQFTPGGKALPYAASLRIKLSTVKADRIDGKVDGKTVVKGHKVTALVVKSKVGAPHRSTQFSLMY